MTVLAVAAASQASPGWGKLLALVVALLGCWAFSVAHQRWRALKDPSSPTPPGPALEGINPQVSGPDDPVDPVGDPVPHEWGQIDYAGGSTRVSVPSRPHASAAVTQAAAKSELDTWVAQRVGTHRPSQIIREARRRFGRSEATVKRAIRRVRVSAAAKDAS